MCVCVCICVCVCACVCVCVEMTTITFIMNLSTVIRQENCIELLRELDILYNVGNIS